MSDEVKADPDKIEVALKKSIQAHGEEVSKITFRSPTAVPRGQSARLP